MMLCLLSSQTAHGSVVSLFAMNGLIHTIYSLGNRRRLLNQVGAVVVLLALLLALGACASFRYAPFDYQQADAPVPLETIPKMENAPRVALVLGAGGPRGYAHIGVMRVLEEAGVEVDLVVGTSVGALLAVLWAHGLDAAQIDQLSTQGGPTTLFDFSLFADRGWVRGQRLQDYVNTQLENTALEALPRRAIVVAARREDQHARFFQRGNAGVAVRASSAMPGIISPVGIRGIEYEDGDMALPLAVSAARDAGARFVIAVNVYPRQVPEDASSGSRAQFERRIRLIEPEVAMADFLIHVDTPYRASPRQKFFTTSRALGEAQARLQLADLLAALAAAG